MKHASLAAMLAASAGLSLATGAAQADQVFTDDVIIQFSLCVGNDCNNGESFGFDTVRLKENNLRIRFQDTSSSGSFPTNDWEITINDSANGGANYFAVNNIDSARTPFRVTDSAVNNALYVTGFSNAPRVGVGTSAPAVSLHVQEGNSPALRLHQDSSARFASQIWDVAGNETNFFIRDVTNGSRLPFRIKPGAPKNSVFIAADGDMIMGGETSPAGDILTIYDDSTERFFGMSIHDATTGGHNWRLVADRQNDSLFLGVQGSACGEMRLDKDGGAEICGDLLVGGGGGGDLTVNGQLFTAAGNSCAGGCDRVFDPEYDLPTIEEHAAYMFANRHLEHVGPTDEDGQINITNHVGGMLNHLEVAHIYIAELNQRVIELEAKLEAMDG